MSLPQIRTEYVFTARVSVTAARVLSSGPEGLRRYVPITGGAVDGPSLKGEVLAGGGDSQLVRPDGVFELEARYVIRTWDGVDFGVLNRGLRHGPADVMARLAQGQPVAPHEYYCRTAPRFDVPADSPYQWLNRAIFIANVERLPDVVVVHVHQVL
jgi:Protein of unknown function (DUF3237)